MPTEDDSGPVSQGEFKLPRALLLWDQYGVAGRAPRGELDSQLTPVVHRDAFYGEDLRASSDAFDEDPTVAMAVVPHAAYLPDAPHGSPAPGNVPLEAALRRAARLWSDRRVRTAAIVAGVALVTYFGIDRASQRSETQTILAPAPAASVAVPIVEQLIEVPQPHVTAAAPQRGKPTDTAERRSVARRAREAPLVATPVSNTSVDRAVATGQSSAGASARPSPSAASGSAGLPAWGAEAVRDFSGAKSNKTESTVAAREAPTTKPPSPSADIPAAPAPGPREESMPAPAVAAKVAAPPEPVAPPRPSAPLTMEQMLNQVEEAAQAQRKKAGLKAPKSSERDAELDALISGAMKKK